jgi:divalent metal cation (Fe/Co/Zn/Cd) transporter
VRIVLHVQPRRSSFDAAQQQMADGIEADRAQLQGIFDGVSYFRKGEGLHQAEHLHILRRIQRIQTVTIVWMTVEAAVSLAAAWMAHSPALLAFGGDSAIELLSAIVVLWRFRVHAEQEQSEKHGARIAAVLLFILAAYVAVASVVTLLGYSETKTSYLGIAILIAAVAIMPWLAKEKRRLSAITGSAALRADAAESALCAYLSLVALVGLGINAIWHVTWADPVAALVIVPLILREGWKAMRGKPCACC